VVNVFVSINEVAVHWAWLLLRRVTLCRQVKHLRILPSQPPMLSFR